MVSKSHAKRRQDIKTKLMAAIAMLLVSSIMMVSSTYAWFTLSTAPEVTGINTAVGANGNLEMALLPIDGSTGTIDLNSGVGDSKEELVARNVTWGNLVELSNASFDDPYGLKQISLYPAQLNIDDAGKIDAASILSTPAYGADGRVSELLSNTSTAVYSVGGTNGTGFYPGAEYGVRAVGVASGMTERQLDYRNASAAANTAAAQAKNAASASLNTNGSALGNIAIKYGTQGTAAVFDDADVTSLKNIVADLQGTENKTGALEYIEEAYIQSILALGASAESGTDDLAWMTVKAAVSVDNPTLDSVIAAIGEDNLPDALKTAIGKYKTSVANVKDAKTKLDALSGGSYNWETQICPILLSLANPDGMAVNGIPAGEIKQDDNMSKLVNSVAGSGLVVTMASGAGVYADIADQCGNYTASIVIDEVTYSGLTLKEVNARMATASEVNPTYLENVAAAVVLAGAPSSGSTATPITDFYGYVIDLAFRTNAAESNLLLQQDAIDRIYGDNTNEETMGHGSSMTFASTTTDFSNDNVKNLMSAIRLVFFDTDSRTILVKGKLDTENASVGADGVTAEIILYTGDAEDNTKVTYVEVTDGTGTHKQVENVTYVEDENVTSENFADKKASLYTFDDANSEYVAVGEGGFVEGEEYFTKKIEYSYETLTEEDKSNGAIKKYKAVTGEVLKDDNVIMALTQNQAHKLSVLVYLDGNNMGNDDVAATAAQSIVGTMNLQFASSATLVPMEYADLHTPGEATYTQVASGATFDENETYYVKSTETKETYTETTVEENASVDGLFTKTGEKYVAANGTAAAGTTYYTKSTTTKTTYTEDTGVTETNFAEKVADGLYTKD